MGLLVSALAMPAVASANTIDFLGTGKVGVVGIQSPSLGNLWVHAGELEWAWQGTPPNGLAAAFYTYCVDANNWVTNPQEVTLKSTNLLTVPGVLDAGGKTAWLVNTYASLIHSNPAYTGTDAAALQVALWEALYDPTPNLWSGNFALLSGTPAAIVTEAQTFLSALFPVAGNGTIYNTSAALWLDAPLYHGQDQIIPTEIPEQQVPTPEPTSLLLCGGGLVGLARIIARQRAAR